MNERIRTSRKAHVVVAIVVFSQRRRNARDAATAVASAS